MCACIHALANIAMYVSGDNVDDILPNENNMHTHNNEISEHSYPCIKN